MEAAKALESRLAMLVEQRHRIQLASFADFIIYLSCLLFILCLSTINALLWDGKDMWIKTGDETVLLGSTDRKL